MTMPRRKPFLRDYADSPRPYIQAVREQQEALHEALHEDDLEGELHALGPLSEAYRMLGQLDVAATHAERALELARQLNKPKFVLSNLIRLATTYQYLNRHEDAEPLFIEARDLARRLGLMEDFALQHHGKSLAEQARWDEAIACFEAALAHRQAKGNPELTASSQEALDEARARRR
jgi:tetratricopeptide (TPR) repeat protein